MKTWTLNLRAGATFGSRHAVSVDPGVLFDHEPIRVVLPHGEMELHARGNVLSREEYYKLTQAVGLMEARTLMSHHGLRVGELSPEPNGRLVANELAA